MLVPAQDPPLVHDEQTQAQQFVKSATIEVRLGFVRKVYGILVSQLILTVAIAGPLSQMQTFVQDNYWLLPASCAVTLVTICAMACCKNLTRTYPTNYIFLFIFTLFEAVTVGFVSAMYSPESVLLAAGMTAFVFFALTVYACKTKKDFTGYGPYLFAALLVLCGFGFLISILSMCSGVNIQWALMAYDLIGVLLFSFYIVYDTQLILGEYGGHKVQFGIDDYVFAALNLYLDIINLFMFLLELFGSRR